MTSPPNRPTRHLPTWACLLALGLLLVVHATLTLAASRHKSATSDEIAHITGGHTFNTWGDFRVQPENGVLPQRWHALPLQWSNPRFPSLDSPTWSHVLAYQLSYDFFYHSGNDPAALLFAARAMNTFWGLGWISLVAGLTWRRFGPAAAVFAAALAALSPTLLAHSALATSDLAMAVGFVASTSLFWWHTHRPGWIPATISATAFGLACVAKFSAVLLLPMLGLLALLRWRCGPAVGGWRSPGDPPAARAKILGTSLLLHGIVAWVIIWALYGFRFSLWAPDLPAGTLPLDWDHVLSAHPAAEVLIFFLRDWHLLPEAFLYGFSYVLAFSEARGAFLDGQLSVTGWWTFFPKTYLYKTPLAEILASLAGLTVLAIFAARRAIAVRSALYRFAPLIVMFGVYWLFSLTSHLNIGHRHILPTYALLLVGSGALVWAAQHPQVPRSGRRMLLAISLLLLGAQVTATVRIHPHHLAFFNSLSGGPTRGYQHLVDSSLDWGQDLPGLATWIERHADPQKPVHLAYFGSGEPRAHHISAPFIARLPTFQQPLPWIELRPGYYAVSATLLQHVYRQQNQPWNPASEATYQTLRPLAATFAAMAGDPAAHPELLDGATPAEWHHAWDLYAELRFARLCEYLKVRPPDAMIGYSILIFDLDAAELAAAVDGDLTSLVQTMETALARPFAPVTY